MRAPPENQAAYTRFGSMRHIFMALTCPLLDHRGSKTQWIGTVKVPDSDLAGTNMSIRKTVVRACARQSPFCDT